MADARDKMYKYRQEISQVSRAGPFGWIQSKRGVSLQTGNAGEAVGMRGTRSWSASWRKPSASCEAALGVTRRATDRIFCLFA